MRRRGGEKRPPGRATGRRVGVDDSTLDKLYARKSNGLQRHWSGKSTTRLWKGSISSPVMGDGDRHVPVDDRILRQSRGCLDLKTIISGDAGGGAWTRLHAGKRVLDSGYSKLG